MAAGCQRKSWLWDPRSLTLHLFAESKSRQVLLLYSSSICGIWGMRHTLRMSYFLSSQLQSLPLTFWLFFCSLCLSECVPCEACGACNVSLLALPILLKASVSYFYRATLCPFICGWKFEPQVCGTKMCHQLGWLLLFISKKSLFKEKYFRCFRLIGY